MTQSEIKEKTQLELEAANSRLQARLDAVMDEVQTFLADVGAPSFSEASARYKRFAAATIELPRQLEERDTRLRNIGRQVVRVQEQADKTMITFQTLRNAYNIQSTENAKLTTKLNVCKETLKMAKDAFESPALSFVRSSFTPVMQAIVASFRELNVVETYNPVEN